MRKLIPVALIVIYIGIALYFKPWESISRQSSAFELTLSIVAIITLLGVVGCSIGMLLGFNLCRKWFLFFNAVFLLFGCYVVYVYWTLWIFKPPTIMERMQSAIMPFILGVVMPIGLFCYYLRKNTINTFKE